jgi:hypothetical protein
MRRHLLSLGLLLGLLAAAPGASAQCTGANHVQWPSAANPVWDFCWTRPSQTQQPNGEGIRLTDVKFRGIQVMKQGGLPVLNVKYDPGGCGGSGLCYRDWFDQESAFSCAPSPSSGYCTGTTTPPDTVCNHPGSTSGSFVGVSVHDQGDHLRLTSQAMAGWYVYISTWEFYPDGRMVPGMDITAVNNSCVAFTHNHHGYFRLDLDVDGAAADTAYRVRGSGMAAGAINEKQTTERSYVDAETERTQWRVASAGSRTRVHVIRENRDGFATGDAFGVADGWLLTYKAGQELNDSSSGCAINIPYANSEAVENTDLVLWVHAMVRHIGEAGGVSHECFQFGPTVKVRVGNEPVDFDGDAKSDVVLYVNGAWRTFQAP